MFEDEQIAALRYEEKKKKYNNIRTGVYVGDDLIKFTEYRLFDSRMCILLPDHFSDMDSENARKKYPSEQRPQIIKTNQSGTVNFTFSLIEEEVRPEQLNGLRDGFHKAIKRLQPADIFLDQGEVPAYDRFCSWMDFRSYALDNDIYNLMFLCIIGGQLLLGMFNCPLREWMDWKEVLTQIMMSLKDLTEEEVYESN